MQDLKSKLSLGLLVFGCALFTSAKALVTQPNFRSPSRDTAAKIYGTTSYGVHLCNDDDDPSCSGTMFIRPAYMRSFHPDALAESLFGNALVTSSDCDDSTIVVSGLFANNRGEKDLMAENFYLPQDFVSTLSFSPRVSTFLIDFHVYIALDHWANGLYFRLYGPFVHNKYSLNFFEDVINPGTISSGLYEVGYFDSAEVPTDELLRRFSDYASGEVPPIKTEQNIKVNGLQFAKMICSAQTDNCFADLRFELGYDFFRTDSYHLGLNIQGAAPTGHGQNAEFLFAPQCGNGKHWELGGGLTAHYTLWQSECEDQHIDVCLEADFTHLFATRQTRTFDLIGKPLSRYMLAMRFNESSTFDEAGQQLENIDGTEFADLAFAGEYSPVANFSTRQVKVSAAIQADVTLMFDYTCNGFSWDLGYNFWYRSCEKIKLTDKCIPFPENTWALKGDASVYGFETETDSSGNTLPNLAAPHPLSATQSAATIYSGLNFPFSEGDVDIFLSNPDIDNTVEASMDGVNPLVIGREIDTTDADKTLSVNTSIQPIMISAEDLDVKGARTRGLSNKIFTHLSYTWIECDNWTPYFGVGAEVEFGKSTGIDTCENSNNTTIETTATSTNCSSCNYCSLTQWGIWFKAGLSFN